MMRKIDYCMLVTNAGGRMRSRPMSSIVKQDEGYVYFLSDARTAKDDEIARDSQILLAYSNGSSQFVSAEATAQLSKDRALIKRLWNPGAQAFWPSGPDDHNIVAIIARPANAEFWDGPGSVVSSVKFAYALITGTAPDMGENSKVTL
jgi:general stress protein 26